MTSDILTFALTVFTGFLAVNNPIVAVPVFTSLTGNKSKTTKKRIAKTATVTAFFIIVVFVILGKYIFELFGITIPAFKISGGILLFFIGLEMLQSKKSSIDHDDAEDDNIDIAYSPLAIPILAGPGSIITSMNYVTDGSYLHIMIVIAVFALMIYLNYLAFVYNAIIIEKLGNNIITVIGKIMGLILTIVGTDMILAGIKIAFSI